MKKVLLGLMMALLLCGCEAWEEFPEEIPAEVPQEVPVVEEKEEIIEEVPVTEEKAEEVKEETPRVFWQESDIPAKDENFRTVYRKFAEREGKTLTITMEIPNDWKFEEGNSTIHDEQDRKACHSLGILRELQEDESIYTLENPEDMPIAEGSSVFGVPQGLVMQTIGVPPDNGRQTAPAKIFSFDFIVENQIVNVHFYVYEDDPDGEMEMMRTLYSLQAEVTPKWEEPPLTWKEVSFKTSVQDPVKGLSEAKTVDISMKVPNRWVLNDEHGVITLGDFHYGDGTKAAEGFVLNRFGADETLESIFAERLLSQMRIPVEGSPTTVTVNGREAFVDVIYLPPYKGEAQPEPDEEYYCYSYYLPWENEGYYHVGIYEQGLDYADMEVHREILESICFGDEPPMNEESLTEKQKNLLSIAKQADILGWNISGNMTEEEKGHFLLTILGSRHVNGEKWAINGGSYAVPLADLQEILAKFTPYGDLEPMKAFADQRYDKNSQTLRLDMLGGYGGARNHGLLELKEEGDRVTVVLGSYDDGFWSEPRVCHLLEKITVEFQLNGENWRILSMTRESVK